MPAHISPALSARQVAPGFPDASLPPPVFAARRSTDGAEGTYRRESPPADVSYADVAI